METATTIEAGVAAPEGVLLVDKPAGLTSHDVVSIVRRVMRNRRVGHTGTLDPFATGLLVVLVGKGTRLIPYIDGEPKVYDATIRFGAETDTDDVTGSVTRTAPVPMKESIALAVPQLTGRIAQVPPAYSAKQVEGRRAYAAARKGAPIELAPVQVNVEAWQVGELRTTDLDVRITCGTGTYIRALARDLGRLTNSAAYLAALRRTCSGPFDVSNAATLDVVKAGAADVLPLANAIPSLPLRVLTSPELVRVLHGNPVEDDGDAPRVGLLDEQGTLVAVADRAGARLCPKIVLRDV